jgi:antitoxin component of MazEF toxin-antitoxin module
MERQIDRLQISAEGVVALPHSLVSRLDLHSGDEILARVDGAKIVLHRMNPGESHALSHDPSDSEQGIFNFLRVGKSL